MTQILPGVKFGHNLLEGITICYRINDTTKTVDFAVVYKHPKDNYNHKLARTLSQERLLERHKFFGTVDLAEIKQHMGEIKHFNIVRYLNFVRQASFNFLPAADKKKVERTVQEFLN
jgi:hypothetical protein